jgi:ribosomal protein S18 acetylase RimI-like enzyme
MRIRAATTGDREAIEGIVAAAYGPYVPLIGMRPRPMDADYGEVVARGDAWVAVGEDAVVGVLVLVAEPETMLIENVAVDPARQGEGIGRALLDHAEEEARARGLGAVRLYTHVEMVGNINLYRQIGYRETRRGGESGFARVFMEKNL